MKNRKKVCVYGWKKILMWSLIFLVCMSAAGCGSTSGSDSKTASKENAGQGVDSAIETPANSDTEADDSGQNADTPEIAAKQGAQAPDIDLTYIDGTTAKLSDYRGKVVLLNLWATWCKPCVGELPAFTRLQEEFGEKLQIVALNCGDSEQTVKEFAKENGYTFAMALDEKLEVMMGAYQTSGIPYTVIIDENGIIRTISEGAGDAETMFQHYKKAIEAAMQQ
ncbi:MAG: TlpA disulfide reductase family protein [Lachnospiraceae bacterium]|nr:TlpA disulfide reductase family protein [Lachnospiraceae bacterium]